ncbi:MAG: NAD(P)/FAD-dependent oxidoreductase [Pseudomonadota bacterium]
MSEREAIVIGGGLAGSTTAIHLARAGKDVLLLEKSRGPHDKVCGEFLSGEALQELRRLGVDPKDHNAHAIDRVTISAADKHAEARLPFEALSLTRRTLDELLLKRAEAEGVDVQRGQIVTGVSGKTISLRHSEKINGRSVVIATGKHDVRTHKRPEGVHHGLVGLKVFAPPTPELGKVLQGTVAIDFFPGGYCGFQLVEDGRINACMAVEKGAMGDATEPLAVFRKLAETSALADAILKNGTDGLRLMAIANIPYGLVRTQTNDTYYVGDQAAVIPSFCGEGMGIALRSGRLAAEAILAGEGPSDFQARFAKLVARRVGWTAELSRRLTRPALQSLAVSAAAAAPWAVTRLAALTRTPNTSALLTNEMH